MNNKIKGYIQGAIEYISIVPISQVNIDKATNLIKVACEEIKNSTKIFNNVAKMKEADLKIDDIVKTTGYYNENDGGAGNYKIMTYDQWYEELAEDVKVVSYCSGWWGYYFVKTPVDEYGNHTFNNGLIAKLVNDDNIIKVEQWGCIGDGVFNNNTPLIHLFGQTKTGTILFGENKIYKIDAVKFNRAYYDNNIFDLFKDDNLRSDKSICITNEYACSACGQYMGGFNNYRRPTIANAENIVLDGNNSEIYIGDNAFSYGGNDFGCFEFINSIDGLEIKNFIFNGNGLKQSFYKDENDVTKSMRDTNHTLFYCGGNCSTLFNDVNTIFPNQFLELGLDSNIYSEYKSKLDNVNIHDNKFKNNGTVVEASDQGGDCILIINPDESNSVYIEDNYFED